jgi:hypothetical protein
MNPELSKQMLDMIEHELGEVFRAERQPDQLLPVGQLRELIDHYERIAAIVPSVHQTGWTVGQPLLGQAVAVRNDSMTDRIMDTFSTVFKTYLGNNGGSIKKARDLLDLAASFGANNLNDARLKCADAAAKIMMEESDESLSTELLGGRQPGEDGPQSD